MRSIIKRESTGGGLNNSKLMRGDTENISVRIIGQNILVANFGFKFTCKVSESDDDASAVIQKVGTLTQVSDTIIEAVFPITSADTEYFEAEDILLYDIQMTTVSPASVRTLQKGKFTIIADITRDNS